MIRYGGYNEKEEVETKQEYIPDQVFMLKFNPQNDIEKKLTIHFYLKLEYLNEEEDLIESNEINQKETFYD